MIPARFQFVEALPRTPSGKVDRPKLRESVTEDRTQAEVHTPPRDDVERRLATIWEDLLQVRPIGIRDDFFDLGGHSLLAVRLAARIEELFGRHFAMADLLVGTTVEELAVRLRAPVAAPRGAALVALSPPGPGRPLVLLHPIGGGVFCYRPLARDLGKDRAIFGLQAAGFEDDAEPDTDLVRMASRYVEILHSEGPKGPYVLGGWSMGGILALEMARLIHEAGAGTPPVLLIDCNVPTPSRTHAIDEGETLDAFMADLAQTAHQDAPLDPSTLAHQVGSERLKRLHTVFRANHRALDGYQPRHYSSRVVLVVAESGRSLFDAAPENAWRAQIGGGLTTYRLPGDHYQIMQRPRVERLAATLAHELDLLDGTREASDPQ
jgi:thioesterase domain-containing protein